MRGQGTVELSMNREFGTQELWKRQPNLPEFLSSKFSSLLPQSGRAATKDPGPRMEHGLNTERESAQLHLNLSLHDALPISCSIRGSPENFVGNERFLLIVVRSLRRAVHGSNARSRHRGAFHEPRIWNSGTLEKTAQPS